MKLVFFDLGDTLESDDVLLPGALETLRGIADLRSSGGEPVVLGLISDFDMPSPEYYAILDLLGIRDFFEPVATRVTLSKEVGAFKPDQKIFREAIDRIDPSLGFGDALFVTERRSHVEAARQLGMQAVHFQGPGQQTGDVDRLQDLIPRVRQFLG
jgi:FMN phosphatase YigB (HAD superfamily)